MYLFVKNKETNLQIPESSLDLASTSSKRVSGVVVNLLSSPL